MIERASTEAKGVQRAAQALNRFSRSSPCSTQNSVSIDSPTSTWLLTMPGLRARTAGSSATALVAGDTAGLSLNALVTVRGMDFAIASGYYAAEAVKKAKAAGDFSAAGLASYEASLRDSFVLRDLETAKSIPSVMENPRLFTHYPQAIGKLLESVYTIDDQPQSGLVKKAWKGARRDFLNVATIKDAWSMRKI